MGVTPSTEHDVDAVKVRVGWHVDLDQRGGWWRVVEVIRHIDPVATSQTGWTHYQKVIIRLENGRTRTFSCDAPVAARTP